MLDSYIKIFTVSTKVKLSLAPVTEPNRILIIMYQFQFGLWLGSVYAVLASLSGCLQLVFGINSHRPALEMIHLLF